MHERSRASFFFYPAEHRQLVMERFSEMHHERWRYLLPVLIVVALFLFVSDLIEVHTPASPQLYRWYLTCDTGLLATQVAYFLAYVLTLRHSTSIGMGFVLSHGFLTLGIAALISAFELHHVGNTATLIIAIMAASMLLLASFFTVVSLVVSAMGVFLVAALLIPGPEDLTFERLMFLFSLAVISVFLSRVLFKVMAENVIAAHELAAVNTELKAAQLNLIQREKFATMGQLSAGIAHEINNPLGFLKSNFSALEQGFQRMRSAAQPRTDAEERFFQTLDQLFSDTREGFRRISEVIDNIRRFAYEGPPGFFELYDLNAGVEAALVMARGSYKQIARIERRLGPLPDIEARGSEINQVLLNIILNAAAAIASRPAAEPGTITISTWKERDFVHCDISDTGPGVRADLREKIFDPFFTTKSAGTGLGLGLSLSRGIVVSRHHGSLRLLDGMPTTFRISLPIHQAPQPQASIPVDAPIPRS